MERPILQGWKEIEAFIGMKRQAIIANGYPIRHAARGHMVCADKREIIEYLKTHGHRVG